jgi:hypothetical protein
LKQQVVYICWYLLISVDAVLFCIHQFTNKCVSLMGSTK